MNDATSTRMSAQGADRVVVDTGAGRRWDADSPGEQGTHHRSTSALGQRPVARSSWGTTTVLLRHLLRMQGSIIATYWLFMALAFGLIGIIYTNVTRDVELSTWDWASQSPKYFLLAMGTILSSAYFPVFVAHGVTRRAFTVAATIWVAGMAAVAGVVMAVGYLVEGAVYRAADWPQVLTSAHVYDDPQQSGLVFLEFLLLTLGHLVAGWLIGTGYYRWGWWGGTAFLLPALLPAVAVEVALSTSWVGDLLELTVDYSPPPLPVGVCLALVAIVAGLLFTYAVLRMTPLRAKK